MNKQLLSLLVVLLCFVACKKEPENNGLEDVQGIENSIVNEECYMACSQKDTVLLHLKIANKNQVAGSLQYKFNEKDRNGGTFKGVLKGDSLIANYSFLSEGVVSSRDMVFLKRGEAYLEGYGEIIQSANGSVRFKNHKNLKFDDSILLLKTDCE